VIVRTGPILEVINSEMIITTDKKCYLLRITDPLLGRRGGNNNWKLLITTASRQPRRETEQTRVQSHTE